MDTQKFELEPKELDALIEPDTQFFYVGKILEISGRRFRVQSAKKHRLILKRLKENKT